MKTTQSDLPLVINDYVASQISFFSTQGHGTLMRSLQRAGKYKPMIQRILAEEGVPQDLIYQAVAESGFQPQAVNGRSGAGGMWQFMPYGTYGLTRNGWYDERFDPEKATRAYARYMKEIYNQLGDWYLAMAGYDWGPGNVQRAVQRTGYADFWELYRRNVLPQETKNYVPVILAAAIMAKNPSQYGFDAMTFDPPLLTGYRDDKYQRRSPSRLRRGRSASAGNCRPEPQPAAHEHSAGYAIRSSSPCRQKRYVRKTHRRDSRRQAQELALSQARARRNDGRGGEKLPRERHRNRIRESDFGR